jgi:signal transduction histidine kinase
MSSCRKSLVLTAALVTGAAVGWAQKIPNWRTYKMADGLRESACLSVTVSAQGKVLARHYNAPFVSELDGYGISVIQLPEIGKGRLYQSPAGQLWTVIQQGLMEFKDGIWLTHPVAEISSEPHISTFLDPVPLCPVKQGVVLFLRSDGLLEFNSGGADPPHTSVLRSASQTGLGHFTGMGSARDGGLWISGASGLAKVPGPLRNLRPETQWKEFAPPSTLGIENLQSPREVPSGDRGDRGDRPYPMVIALAESTGTHQKVLAVLDGPDWSVESLPSTKVRQVWYGPDQRPWGTTIDSLFQWVPGSSSEIVENDEVSAQKYYDVAVEPGGNFWLATSDGLFRYSPPLWRGPAPVREVTTPVRCVTGDQEGRLWFVAGTRLYSYAHGALQSRPLPGSGTRALQVRGLYFLRNQSLILETEDPESNAESQLFSLELRDRASQEITAVHPGFRCKVLGLFSDGTLCVQDRTAVGDQASGSLARYDGRQMEGVMDSTNLPYLGAHLRALFQAQNGDLWVSGDSGTAWYHDRRWTPFTSSDRSTPEAPVSFIELGDGKIWCADPRQVWEFDGRSWTVVRSGFDQINMLWRTRDGNVWVASNSGLHRFVKNIWIEHGVDEGLPSSAVRELFEDQQGLWAATTRGLSLFHPQADRDPPAVVIQQPAYAGGGPSEGTVLTLSFTGQDKWRFTPPGRLLFSYVLDDGDWSAYQEGGLVTYTDLRAGKHSFKVRAIDRNANQSKETAQLNFAVVLPWYRETRLVLISITGLVAALFFAAVAFNRHRQLLRSYAEVEKKVAERTLQLELANQELLQSQKMRALGTLAAGIAHDFNNILSIVKGSAQIIEDNLENPEKIRSRADRIKTVTDQGAGIVRAMLGFSRDSGQEMTPCDINAVVDDTLKLLGDRFLREVQVKYQPTFGLPRVITSKDFIQQILLNFIFNAAEAMATNKEILLRSRLMDTLPKDLVLLPEAAPLFVGISVQDFGCGIAPEILPRIFEPFFTTKARSSRRGTGLGLSMVYELAKKLGAGLWVESALQAGSTFTLILPASAGIPASPAATATRA